jgi:hypothetical protein
VLLLLISYVVYAFAGSCVLAHPLSHFSRFLTPFHSFFTQPTWHESIRAYLDVIQVGPPSDAFFVKIRTQFPTSVAVIQMLQGTDWVPSVRCIGYIRSSFPLSVCAFAHFCHLPV